MCIPSKLTIISISAIKLPSQFTLLFPSLLFPPFFLAPAPPSPFSPILLRTPSSSCPSHSSSPLTHVLSSFLSSTTLPYTITSFSTSSFPLFTTLCYPSLLLLSSAIPLPFINPLPFSASALPIPTARFHFAQLFLVLLTFLLSPPCMFTCLKIFLFIFAHFLCLPIDPYRCLFTFL